MMDELGAATVLSLEEAEGLEKALKVGGRGRGREKSRRRRKKRRRETQQFKAGMENHTVRMQRFLHECKLIPRPLFHFL